MTGGGEHEFLSPSGGGVSTSREDHGSHHEAGSARMTNADFRKLMMTPRAGHGATALGALGAGNTPSLGGGTVPSGGVGKTRVGPSRATPGIGGQTPVQSGHSASSEKAEKRKKKKSFYAKLKRQEDDKMAELAAKYRDRAKERRDGGFPGEKVEAGDVEVPADAKGSRGTDSGPAPHTNTSSGYRAVAPDVKSSRDAAERRRQLISESKFLGGDMEHTHLVKGLDFALLQKVRSEICHREKTAGEEEEGEKHSSTGEDKSRKREEKGGVKEDNEDHVGCRTVLAKNVLRAAFRTDMPDRNELFFPGRMAYVIDLEEEFGQGDDAETNANSDIPTTTIRSKADVQGNLAHQQAVSMSANDIVINKLAQILSYLRAAGSRGKKKKKDKLIPRLPIPKSDAVAAAETNKNPGADLPIYDDADEYVPSYEKQSSRVDGKRQGRSDRDRRETRRDDRGRHHRDRDWDDRSRRDKDRDSRRHGSSRHDSKHSSYFNKKDSYEEEKSGFSGQDKDLLKNLLKREEVKTQKADKEQKGKQMMSTENDVYAECYPGLEMNDAIEDSDDEVDYTKMDLGNKKGPVGRWDFDTAEEYADYMSQKEAMPKAAFQYGVKMTEGRKTRGKVGVKNEKAKLDKEWNKISALIDTRKGSGVVVGGGPSSKKQKFN